MAVRVLPTVPVRSAPRVAEVPPVALAAALVPAAMDLVNVVLPAVGQVLVTPSAVASALAAAVMLALWLRYPRTSWLAAATLAAGASLVLRMGGVEQAPVLTLLSIVSLGIGGAFASGELS